MKWFDFTDTTFVIVFVITLVLILLVAFVIATYVLMNYNFKSYEKKIEQESISTRIFAIDVKNNVVTFFNRSDMKDKKEMDFSSFCFHFHPNDTDKVKEWILSIMENPKTCDQYLEADVVVNRGMKAGTFTEVTDW